MRQLQKRKRPTSIWTDTQTREALKQLAEKMGVSQGKCLSLLIEEKNHRDKVYSKKKREEFENLDIPDAINQINRRLEKIEKRENPRDTIVSFFRTQEKDILKPMREETRLLLTKLDSIIEALTKVK